MCINWLCYVEKHCQQTMIAALVESLCRSRAIVMKIIVCNTERKEISLIGCDKLHDHFEPIRVLYFIVAKLCFAKLYLRRQDQEQKLSVLRRSRCIRSMHNSFISRKRSSSTETKMNKFLRKLARGCTVSENNFFCKVSST